MSPRAVILSGSLGEGHAAAARACRRVLADLGWAGETWDAMALLGSRAGAAGELVFRRLLGLPGVYDAFHFTQLRPGGGLALGLDRLATTRLVPRLRSRLAESPVEALISVFPTGASAAAVVKRTCPRLSTVVVCTDVTVHRLWVQDETDLFVVTSPAAAASVRRYRPHATVAVVPTPVETAFLQAPPQAAARAALGLPEREPCVVVMGGGWGLGPLTTAAASLADAGVQVLAVAGHNRRVERHLRAAAVGRARLHPFGYTDRIAELMAASDAVVTTPGATTCAEARAVGRHLVLLDSVAGHGRENVLHQLALGDAEVCDPSPWSVTASVRALLPRLPGPATRRGPDAWVSGFGDALRSIGLAPAGAEATTAPLSAPLKGPAR